MDRRETPLQHPLFGDYLIALLRERECSGSRLAGMVGVDPALIYRWLRNEAVPKLDAPYRETITRHLALSQEEAERLKAAQVYSLSLPAERRARARNGGAAVERLISQTRARQHPAPALTAAQPVHPDPVPRPNGVIWGRPHILEAVIRLLESLPSLTRQQNKTILLSFQGEEDAFDNFPELREQYQQAIEHVLRRGWSICHLWRLDHDVRRSILLVENMLKLLGTGRYRPYYIRQYGILAPPYDLLVIPQTAAMLFFATQNTRRSDAALLTHDPEQMELFHTHFYQLMAQSQPLIKSYLPQEEVEALAAYAEAEARPGGRVAIKNGLTFLAEPPSWYDEHSPLAQSLDLSDAARNAALVSQRRRLAAFLEHIGSSTYRDICPRRAIERLVCGGEPTQEYQARGIRFSAQERREQLERILSLLTTYEHYQLALIDEEEEQAISIERCWEVAGGQTVLLLTWSTDSSGKDILLDLLIHEPTIARAFQDYFDDLWEQIAPEHKDKIQVIRWLEDQLARLT
jgi:transcriptional regulator with XRE-family HTH domain